MKIFCLFNYQISIILSYELSEIACPPPPPPLFFLIQKPKYVKILTPLNISDHELLIDVIFSAD